MTEQDQNSPLVAAVTNLTNAVQKLDQLLRDEYPKRSEIERKFVSKLENQKIITKVIIVALITVLGCYVMTIGAYSQCLIGDESPGVCKYVPGYSERIERKNELNDRDTELEQRIKQLEKRLEGRGASQ